MRSPATPSTRLTTRVGVSASLVMERRMFDHCFFSSYCSPAKLALGVNAMVVCHVMLPKTCGCGGCGGVGGEEGG